MGIKWLCTAPEAKTVEGFVNVSGRYRMEVSRVKLSQKISNKEEHVTENQA